MVCVAPNLDWVHVRNALYVLLGDVSDGDEVVVVSRVDVARVYKRILTLHAHWPSSL